MSMTLALVGAGKWGQNYLRAVKHFSGVKIRYVCSENFSLQKISSEYIKLTDYRKLAEKKDLDGVIIAVPSAKHFELAHFFLSRGKPILIEKPMTVSLGEARKLEVLYKKTNGKVMVGNIFLYNDAFKKFKKLADAIEKKYYLQFEGCDFGPIRDDTSALWDWGPHDISMCLDLFGKKPLSVCAWAVSTLRPSTKLYDMVYARLIFEKNIPVSLRMGWLSPVKKREILLVGQNESILFNDISDKKIIHFDRFSNPTEITYPVSEPLVNQLKDFTQMIEKNKKPVSDFKKNVAIIEVLDAMERSIENHGLVIKIKR